MPVNDNNHAGNMDTRELTLEEVACYPDACEMHASLAAGHIWCRRLDWADDLLRQRQTSAKA